MNKNLLLAVLAASLVQFTLAQNATAPGDLQASNTLDDPNRIAPVVKPVAVTGQTLRFILSDALRRRVEREVTNSQPPQKKPMKYMPIKATLLTSLLAVQSAFAAPAPMEAKVEEFPLSAVRLDESSPFYKAMQIDRTYLFSLNYDRLLSHMRKSAGLTPKAPPYGNWEGKSWTIGHAMSALSMLYAATGDKEALEKLNYAVDGVAECQNPDTGFIAQNDWCWKMFEDIANDPKKDETPTDRWQVCGIKEYKVPFYYVHKLNAGLLDAWRFAGNEKAKAAFLKHCDWICSYMDRFTDAQFENVLYVEHGGLNETLAEAAAIAPNKADAEKYLRNAKKFSHKEMLLPLAEGKDILPKMHANTQIPKFVGFRRIADLSGDQQYADAARNFWNIVVDTQTFSPRC
jgi:DUF1680 family protein